MDQDEEDLLAMTQTLLGRFGSSILPCGTVTRHGTKDSLRLDMIVVPGENLWQWELVIDWSHRLSDHARLIAKCVGKNSSVAQACTPAYLKSLLEAAINDLRAKFLHIAELFLFYDQTYGPLPCVDANASPMKGNLPFVNPLGEFPPDPSTTQSPHDTHQPILFHPNLAKFGYSVMDGYLGCWWNTWRKKGRNEIDLGIELAEIAKSGNSSVPTKLLQSWIKGWDPEWCTDQFSANQAAQWLQFLYMQRRTSTTRKTPGFAK